MYWIIDAYDDDQKQFEDEKSTAEYIAHNSAELASFDESLNQDFIDIEFCGRRYSYSDVFQKIDSDYYEFCKSKYYKDLVNGIVGEIECLTPNYAEYIDGFYVVTLI